MAGLAINVNQIRKVFGEGEAEVQALRGVDLDVKAGEFVAIMGPSGSGKSTLLHIIGALESATEGEVSLGENSLKEMSERDLTRLRRDNIGFVFQFFNLLATLTAEENVLLPALISGENVKGYQKRTKELLELVGLTGRGNHLPSQLSGGEQQRVSIARALLKQPELVLADEPTGNLDSKNGEDVLGLLRDVCDKFGHTVVMVSHDANDASHADRVVFLRDGLIAGSAEGGDPRLLMEKLQMLETGTATDSPR